MHQRSAVESKNRGFAFLLSPFSEGGEGVGGVQNTYHHFQDLLVVQSKDSLKYDHIGAVHRVDLVGHSSHKNGTHRTSTGLDISPHYHDKSPNR